MKKFMGVVLIIISSILALLSLSMIGLEFAKESASGFSTTTLRVLTLLGIVFIVMVIVLFVGLRLVRPHKKRAVKADSRSKPSKRPVEAKPNNKVSERQSSIYRPSTSPTPNRAASSVNSDDIARSSSRFMDTPVSSGPFTLWKCRGDRSSEKHFAAKSTLVFIGIILFAMLGTIACSIFLLTNGNADKNLSTALLSFLVVLVVILAITLGQRMGSRLISFAVDSDGKMYMFNYNSPEFKPLLKRNPNIFSSLSSDSSSTILKFFADTQESAKLAKLIDDNHIIEDLMLHRRIYPYGKRLVHVSDIVKKPSYSRIYCTVFNGSGRLQDTSIVISKDYNNYDDLIEKLEHIYSFDYARKENKNEKYLPALRILNVVTFLITLVCLFGCLETNRLNVKASHDSTKVKSTVVSVISDKVPNTYTSSSGKAPKVKVSYNDKVYDLMNVTQGSWYYKTNRYIDTYLYNNKMYANIEGVRSDTPLGKLYFVSLFSLMGFGLASVILFLASKSITHRLN